MILVIVSATAWWLVNVMLLDALGLFSPTLPKLREVGLSTTGASPDPDKATV